MPNLRIQSGHLRRLSLFLYHSISTHYHDSNMTTDISSEISTLASRYENEAFLEADPSRFMHEVEGDTNRETTAFVASALSYGSRRQFFPRIRRIIDLAHGDVHHWVTKGLFADDIADDDACFYRLYTNHTMRTFLSALRSLLLTHGSLRSFVAQAAAGSGDALDAVAAICRYFAAHGSVGVIPKDTTSACKRVCMFMRWMVRDGSPVDLGLWADIIDKRTLIMPLDTHVLQEAARMGLISGKSASMSTARKLTMRMREIFPDDPLRADFALFGLGVDDTPR